jgi:sugar lactone lactonase YvrE
MLQNVTPSTRLPFRAGALAGLLAVLCGLASGAFAAGYRVESLIPEATLHGANGMHFDANGDLIVGSMMSGTVSRLDIDTGELETLVGSPRGIADDLTIGPDGLIVWTTMPMGIVHAMRPGGKVYKIATNLPLINSIYFTRNGRLFAAQVTEGEGSLFELDPAGEKPPRVVIEGLLGLNGFEITDDDILYGPLMNGGAVIRIDLNTLEVTEVANGFPRPVAVNLDSKGNLYVVDILTGELTRVDPDTGAKKLVVQLEPPIDNLAISDDDLIYVSHHCHHGISEVDPSDGSVRQVASGSIGMPAGGMLIEHEGRDTLFVSGMMCQSLIDVETGAVKSPPRQGDVIWSSWLDRKGDTVVLSSFAFGQIQWIDANTGAPTKTLSGFSNPYAIKILPDDSLLIAEYGSGRILRLAPPYDGEPAVVAEGLDGPLGFVLARDAILYVTEAAGGIVSSIDIDDGKRSVVRDGLNQPEGIALLDDGRLVVAEVGAKRVIALNPDNGTDEPEIIASDLPLGLPPFMGPPKTFLPTGVIVGKNGIIYVTADISHTVLKLTPVAN